MNGNKVVLQIENQYLKRVFNFGIEYRYTSFLYIIGVLLNENYVLRSLMFCS